MLRWRPASFVSLVILLSALAWALPLGNALSLPLEKRFAPPARIDAEALAGIIVLAGDYARFQAGVALPQSTRACRLFSLQGRRQIAFAPSARKHHIAEGRMTFELKSTTTCENAIQTRRLLTAAEGPVPGRWLLVTSAIHMPRAGVLSGM